MAPVRYRKNTAKATRMTAGYRVLTIPAQAMQTAQASRQVTSTTLRENIIFPVFLNTKSEMKPPKARPRKPSTQGMTVAMLMSLTFRPWAMVR
ncbi:hypothetical protein D3C81_1852380 [compost metagenome]